MDIMYSTYQPTLQINNNTQSHHNDMQQTVKNNQNYILCGRGKVNAKHHGNKIFAKSIQSSINDYINADSKMGKVIVVASVIDFIHAIGMKFVTYNALTKTYEELSSERIHTKVSHAIRDQIKQNKKVERRTRGASQTRKQKRRAASPFDDLSSRTSENTNKTTDDGFDAWWSQHKNECCEHIMSQHATPSALVTSTRIEESPAYKSIICDDEIDDLTVSRTIFDFGAKIEEITSCEMVDIPAMVPSHSTEEGLVRIVSEEMPSDLYSSLPLFPSSSAMNKEEGSPLTAKTEPESEAEDVEKTFSLILDNKNDEDFELFPSLVLDNEEEDFLHPPDQCCSSQLMF